MNQTQSLQEHLTALHDELNAAAKTEDDEARKCINDALAHLEAAQEQLKTRTGARTEQIGAHLDALQDHAANAMNERGDSLRIRIHKMMESCRNAIEVSIEEQTMTP
jgi:polyhydroxyalkanoate synthesis regulator phasin